MSYNDELVSKAFSNQSIKFDYLDSENKLTKHLREIYRAEIDKQIKPNSKILELNCGTGIDGIYFAQKGHYVTATDNANGMLNILQTKIEALDLNESITAQRCSFADLSKFKGQKFDYIISNFGGLNCTGNLNNVIEQFKDYLEDDGKITLVVMPKVAPWELIMAFKGDYKTAFRRLRKHAKAHIDGVNFLVYYYNPSYIINTLKLNFNLITLRGIYFAVPPEFYQNFVQRYPKLYEVLQKVESKLCSFFPFNFCCDHFMITFQLKSL